MNIIYTHVCIIVGIWMIIPSSQSAQNNSIAPNKTELALGDDTYNFCGKNKNRGDHSACKGYCKDDETKCSKELGVCACKTDKRISEANANYNCRVTTPRSRCSNACKSYVTLHPKFRKGATMYCVSRIDETIRCFCLGRSQSVKGK